MNDTMGEETNVTYSAHCSSPFEEEIITPFFAGATNCTKDFMAVSRGVGVLWILLRGLRGRMARLEWWLGTPESWGKLQPASGRSVGCMSLLALPLVF